MKKTTTTKARASLTCPGFYLLADDLRVVPADSVEFADGEPAASRWYASEVTALEALEEQREIRRILNREDGW